VVLTRSKLAGIRVTLRGSRRPARFSPSAPRRAAAMRRSCSGWRNANRKATATDWGAKRLNLRHHALHSASASDCSTPVGPMRSATPSTSPRATSGGGCPAPGRTSAARSCRLSHNRSSKPRVVTSTTRAPRRSEQRVSRDRRAVDQDVDRSRQKLDRPKHSHRGIVRCRHDLADRDLAVVRERDEVSEGATDVDADPHRHCPRNCGCGLRIGGLSGSAPSRTTSPCKSAIRNPQSAFSRPAPRSPALHHQRAGEPQCGQRCQRPHPVAEADVRECARRS